MLNALRRFIAPALAHTMYNVVFIVCHGRVRSGVHAIGIEPVRRCRWLLLGGVAQVVSQWPALRAEGYRHHGRSIGRDQGCVRYCCLWAGAPSALRPAGQHPR